MVIEITICSNNKFIAVEARLIQSCQQAIMLVDSFVCNIFQISWKST